MCVRACVRVQTCCQPRAVRKSPNSFCRNSSPFCLVTSGSLLTGAPRYLHHVLLSSSPRVLLSLQTRAGWRSNRNSTCSIFYTDAQFVIVRKTEDVSHQIIVVCKAVFKALKDTLQDRIEVKSAVVKLLLNHFCSYLFNNLFSPHYCFLIILKDVPRKTCTQGTSLLDDAPSNLCNRNVNY